MLFDVLRTRYEGRPIARHGLVEHGRFRGWLTLKSEMDDLLHRHMYVARLIDQHGKPVKGLPELRDAMLVHVHRGFWVLSGWEVPSPLLSRQQFTQSWLMAPIDEIPLEELKAMMIEPMRPTYPSAPQTE